MNTKLIAAFLAGHLAAECGSAESIGAIEKDWLLQDGMATAEAAYLRACARRRRERLGQLMDAASSFVFLRNTEFGNAPRLDMSLSDGPYDGNPFAPGAAVLMYSFTRDGRGRIETLLDDPGGMIRDLDVSYDGRRILFAWKKNRRDDDFHIHEMVVADRTIRQVTAEEGVADIQPRYLPDGRILYHSSRCVTVVDCNESIDVVNLYSCDPDGGKILRLTHDQVSTQFPAVLDDGRIVYTRWDYNDRGQIFPQGLFTMNPDGTRQAALYGNNSWFPTSLIQARSIPGSDDLVAIASGHHTPPCGSLALVQVSAGREEGRGIRLLAPERAIEYERKDRAMQDGAVYQYPWPLNRDEFLVGCAPDTGAKRRRFGIYWVDRDGGRELLAWDAEGDCRHPVPLVARQRPVARSTVTDPAAEQGIFYVENVYLGRGLEGVPEGTVKKLRVIALGFRPAAVGTNYNEGEAGNARVCTPVSISGAWDTKTVLGDATVHADGSAMFHVPARTPVYFQALDADGQAVQSMRSWSTLQPGESFSCVGCHADKNSAPATTAPRSMAMMAGPRQLVPFHGKVRGFSFLGEVQPILDRNCVGCHKGEVWSPGYRAPAGEHGISFSLSAEPVGVTSSRRKWTESYIGLLQAATKKGDQRATYFAGSNSFINWISPQSGPEVLKPYSFGAARSPMLAMLREGHRDVVLSAGELETIACWIDLAVPFCGDYTEAHSWSEREMNWYRRQVGKQRRLAAREGE